MTDKPIEPTLDELFFRLIVKREPLENNISDEIELDCGHVVIRIIGNETATHNYCALCMLNYVDKLRAEQEWLRDSVENGQ